MFKINLLTNTFIIKSWTSIKINRNYKNSPLIFKILPNKWIILLTIYTQRRILKQSRVISIFNNKPKLADNFSHLKITKWKMRSQKLENNIKWKLPYNLWMKKAIDSNAVTRNVIKWLEESQDHISGTRVRDVSTATIAKVASRYSTVSAHGVTASSHATLQCR